MHTLSLDPMASGPRIETSRLILRRWRKSDLEPFVALNSDPEVMEHYSSTLDERQTAEWMGRIEASFDERGYGLWALQHGASKEFLGYAGLWVPSFEAHFTPTVEVSWRLSRSSWGNGYATEAARAAMRYGFEQADLTEIVSFTAPANTRSIRVMERLGLAHDPADDFDHPNIAEGSSYRRHVLYRMSRDRWSELNPGGSL